MRSRILLLSAVLRFGAASLPAQSTEPPKWQIGFGAALGTPGGWIQVREWDIEGTRLRFRRDLNVARIHELELRAEYHARPGRGIGLTLASWALNGSTRLPADVLFNGTTLAGGSILTTRTDFPNFLRITLDGWWPLARLGRHGSVSWSVGLTAVLLNFRLKGTEAPTSVGHEPKEDFLTQELPVPIVGIRVRYPFSGRMAASAALSGGYLPWVNSLRSEGGVVRLTQSHADLDIGVEYAVTRSSRVVGGFRFTDFTQREKSREDGNDINLRASLLTATVLHRF